MRRDAIAFWLFVFAAFSGGATVASESDLNGDGVVEEATSPQQFPPCPPGGSANAADVIVAVGYTAPSSPV